MRPILIALYEFLTAIFRTDYSCHKIQNLNINFSESSPKYIYIVFNEDRAVATYPSTHAPTDVLVFFSLY